MTGVHLLGAGKFALQVARWVRDADWTVRGFVVTGDEPPSVPADLVVDAGSLAGDPVLLALSDVDERRTALARFPDAAFVTLVHPTSVVDDEQLTGTGTVIGPFCYVGADATLGGFTLVSSHSSVGNHCRLGTNNFLSPAFHCGNSVEIGDDNFFGLSCAVAPEVRIGDRNVFSAGVTVFEEAGDDRIHLSTARVKALPRTTP